MKYLLDYLKMIKVEHTVFALPFALAGMLYGARDTGNSLPSLAIVFWIVIAVVGARSAAMGINRLVDADIDAKNPRTKNRELPAKVISKLMAFLIILLSVFIYFFAAYSLGKLPFYLSPIPVIVFIVYAYSKRFTLFCHIILGIALGISPIGAYIAVSDSLSIPILFLGAGVALWVAGFDIIYAILDIEFDNKEGLHSIPSRVGLKCAKNIAISLHILAFTCFIISGILFQNSFIYFIGIFISLIIMVYEHISVRSNSSDKIAFAFFNMNAYISIIIFIAIAMDIFILK